MPQLKKGCGLVEVSTGVRGVVSALAFRILEGCVVR